MTAALEDPPSYQTRSIFNIKVKKNDTKGTKTEAENNTINYAGSIDPECDVMLSQYSVTNNIEDEEVSSTMYSHHIPDCLVDSPGSLL